MTKDHFTVVASTERHLCEDISFNKMKLECNSTMLIPSYVMIPATQYFKPDTDTD